MEVALQDASFTKVCPRCGARLFRDMHICYGCLYDFDHPQPIERPPHELVQEAERIAKEAGYAFMQVKTVRMGVYEDYDRTNLFYISCGFLELEVIEAIWGAENPCQIYIKSL